jgi:ribosomal protein S18 acetylase RimI-like enzyme
MSILATLTGLSLALIVPLSLAMWGDKLFRNPDSLTSKCLQQLFLATLFAGICCIVIFWEKKPLSSIGLYGLRWQSIIWGLIFAAFLIFVYSPILIRVMNWFGIPGFENGLGKLTSLPIWYLIIAVVIGGIVEEGLYGFTIERYFLSMTCELTNSIPQPQIPRDFTVRQVNGSSDAQQWVELYNESFFDHWNYHEYTIDNYYHWLSDSNYKPELDLVAITPDGKFAAFCRCWINSERNNRNEQKEGSIDILGTRRDFRRMGLARALLLTGMQQLKENGMNIAKLNVDADNSNRAALLYESVGFSKAFTRIRFVKDVC